LAPGWLGGVFGLLGPFQKVADYLQGVKEKREVREQLKKALASIHSFMDGVKNSRKAGEALVVKFDALEPLVTVGDVEDLMMLSGAFNDSYETVLNSICDFGKECHDLISGNYEGFMTKVKLRKPEVYDFLNSFGRNYNPKRGTMDLSFLPMLIRIYGPKVGWEEDKEANKAVEEGKKKIEKAMRIAKGMKGRRLPLRNRALIVGYVRSMQRLARAARRLSADAKTTRELRKGAPTWYVELMAFVERAGKELPGGSGSALG
jgi:hypothetical protein